MKADTEVKNKKDAIFKFADYLFQLGVIFLALAISPYCNTTLFLASVLLIAITIGLSTWPLWPLSSKKGKNKTAKKKRHCRSKARDFF